MNIVHFGLVLSVAARKKSELQILFVCANCCTNIIERIELRLGDNKGYKLLYVVSIFIAKIASHHEVPDCTLCPLCSRLRQL